ncbi:hypothetical protein MXB_856, partial [Myxobolus squamalis]
MNRGSESLVESEFKELSNKLAAICFIGSVLFSFIIPKTGSKSMMIIGFTGMSLSFAVAYGLTYFENMSIPTVIFLSLYLFWFQCGPGPKPWS